MALEDLAAVEEVMLVSVETPEETVLVTKSGPDLIVSVSTPDETARVRAPLAMLAEVVNSYDGDSFGLAGAVSALRSSPGKLVYVKDSENEVNIFIWQRRAVLHCIRDIASTTLAVRKAWAILSGGDRPMMRLCCLSLSYGRQFNAGTMDIFKFLDTCRELNLDGVSVHIRNLNGTDKPHLKEVRRRCLDLGLTMACFCVSTRFGGPEDTHPAEIAKAREAMEVGMFLGAPLLRVFVGRVPDGDDYEASFQRGVRGLRKTAELGAEFGMPVALQNHSGLTSTGDEMVRFKKEIDHPNFTLLLDTGHFTGRKGPNGPVNPEHDYDDYYDSIAKVALLAQFVRAKLYDLDDEGREQWIDYDKVFNILRGVHFNGFISLVYEGKEDQATAIPRGNRFLRSYLTV